MKNITKRQTSWAQAIPEQETEAKPLWCRIKHVFLPGTWQPYVQTELNVYIDQSAENTELKEEMEIKKLCMGRVLFQKWQVHCTKPFYWRKSESEAVSNSLRPHGLQPTRLLRPWDLPGKSTGVGSHSLLQRIFLTHLGLLHCRQTLDHLSHQGSPFYWRLTPIKYKLTSQISADKWYLGKEKN